MRLVDADILEQKVRSMKLDVDSFAKAEEEGKINCIMVIPALKEGFEKIIATAQTVATDISIATWIQISERMPEPATDVLIQFSNNSMIVGWVDSDYKKWNANTGKDSFSDVDYNGEVIAWMPLPQPLNKI